MELIELGIECPMPSTQGGGSKKSYPCLYITSEKEIDLASQGTAEIKYRVVEKSESSRNGKTSYRYELEVQGITPTSSSEEDADEKEESGAGKKLGEALKKIGVEDSEE